MPQHHKFFTLAVVGQANSGKSTISSNLVNFGDAGKPEAGTKDLAITAFGIRNCLITVIDTPGKIDHAGSVIAGASQADCALIVVSAAPGEFEAGFAEGGETREHLQFCAVVGIQQAMIAVNKMDCASPKYSESRFNEIKNQLSDYMRTVGLNPNDTPIVPVSGSNNENVGKISPNMSWWKPQSIQRRHGSDYSYDNIMSALDNVDEPSRPVTQPLRITVLDSYIEGGVGTKVVGRVEAGRVKTDDTIVFTPNGHTTQINHMDQNHSTLSAAMPGHQVTLELKTPPTTPLKRGDVISSPDNDPAKEVESVLAQVVVVDGEIKVGYSPMFYCHTASGICKVSEMVSKVDRRGRETEQSPSSVKSGEVCIARLVPSEPLCVDSYGANPQMGRFIIRDGNKTVGFGIIKEVVKKN